MPAALRLIHPAPAAAVIALSAAIAVILALQAGRPLDWRVWLTVVSIAGSQVATGAFNDWADRARDAVSRPEKPIPAGDLAPNTAVAIGVGGALVQLASSAALGIVPLALGATALGSALAYNVWLSRTPLSVVPYLVSFGVLPAWIAAGIGVPLERVAPASLLVAPFAASAHLANTARDFDVDAVGGSRSLAQVLGRERSHRIALILALAVGIGFGAALAIAGRLTVVSGSLGLIGLLAVALGAPEPRRLWYGLLVAAVCWAAAWALATA
jgi:4-hydroxybenzoate polyprenyltransferase